MKFAGILEMFKHSIGTQSVCYINYLGDGDSEAYETVRKSDVYGPNVIIEKLKCIGHVQKRMGTRLHNLRKSLEGKISFG